MNDKKKNLMLKTNKRNKILVATESLSEGNK